MLLRGHLCSLPIVVDGSRDHHIVILIIISVICNWYCPTSHIQQLSLKTSYTSWTSTPSMVTIADWQRLFNTELLAHHRLCCGGYSYFFVGRRYSIGPWASRGSSIDPCCNHQSSIITKIILNAIFGVHHRGAEYGMAHEWNRAASSSQWPLCWLLHLRLICAHSDFTIHSANQVPHLGGFSIATMLCQSHSCRSWHCNYMQHATTIISLEMRSTTTLQLDHLILTTVLIAFTLPFPLALTAMTTPPHSCDHFGTAHLVDFFFVAEEVW